jgi:hypothetical protein
LLEPGSDHGKAGPRLFRRDARFEKRQDPIIVRRAIAVLPCEREPQFGLGREMKSRRQHADDRDRTAFHAHHLAHGAMGLAEMPEGEVVTCHCEVELTFELGGRDQSTGYGLELKNIRESGIRTVCPYELGPATGLDRQFPSHIPCGRQEGEGSATRSG